MGWFIRLTNFVVHVKWRCRYFSVGLPGICQPLFVCLFCSVFWSCVYFLFPSRLFYCFHASIYILYCSSLTIMVKVCSYNVKGLGNKEKRRIIFQWLKDNKVDICFIQEDHYTSTFKETRAKDWDGDKYFSGNNSRSMGVGILLNNTLISK